MVMPSSEYLRVVFKKVKVARQSMVWLLGVAVGFLALIGVGASATHYLQEPYNPGFLILSS